ncbi:hypothetical protein BD779DRAFT_1154023 [Infundibulicybe gibba]|nr:hypothetical protein BD779DRAFT_1154023 [Infundibulicybe gibba]
MPTFEIVLHDEDEVTGQEHPLTNNHSPPFAPTTPSMNCIPLPRTVGRGHVALHPDLCSNNISFDVSQPPVLDLGSPSHNHWLHEPATYPNLQSLTILSKFLPWPIVVHASLPRPSVVTIADILSTVHKNLITPMSEHEYKVLCPNSGGPRYCWNPHVTRLALLRGHYEWAGLSPSFEGPEVFFLHLHLGGSFSGC